MPPPQGMKESWSGATKPPGKALLESMQAHPTFAAFLAPEFDPAAFASDVVTADATEPSTSGKSRAELVVQEISTHLSRVTEAIDRHIIHNQDALMHSIGDLGEIRESSNVLSLRTKDLKRSVDKLKSELMEPFQSTEMRRNQLERIHEAQDLLKKLSRFSFTLLKIRKGGLESPAAVKAMDLRELARAAANLLELENLLQDETLCSLGMVSKDMPFVLDLGRGVRKAAKDSLHAALKTMNQADLGPSLQVFYNLQSLPPVMLDALNGVLVEAIDATKRAFDAHTLERIAVVDATSGEGSQSSDSPLGQQGPNRSMSEMEAIAVRQRRARYRDHCEKWGDALSASAMKVWNLQRMLMNRVDATTNGQFLDVVLRSSEFSEALKKRPRGDRWPSSVGTLYWKFWTDLSAAIRAVSEGAIKRMGSGSPVVRCYPFLSLTLTSVLNRLVDNTSKHKGGMGMGLPTSHGVVKGNAVAMRALMEVLQGGEEGKEGETEGPREGGVGEVGGSIEERDVLLQSLASVRDLYLGESLQRLCRPIDQMFPKVEGYSSAIPSKHDLQAFVRVILGELLAGLAEGGPLLLPLLIRGAVKAVRLFCSKVESMANTGEGAHKHYPLRQWVLTPEKEHNLQLLSLLALLHASLHKMPAQLAHAGAEFIGAVGAGSLGTAEIDRACDVIADLAKSAFIRPYLLGICNELGAIMANMHLENYAPGGVVGEEEASRFVLELQDAVGAIKKNHLSRFPANVDFTSRGLRWLAARLLRMYVSQAALVRPVNERGKSKLNKDAAMMETILGGLSKVSELGGAHQELRAFRELLFYGDEHSPFTVNGALKENFVAALRPSTLLDFLFSRAPPELSSPHVLQRCSERTLVDELLAMFYADQDAGMGPSPPAVGSEPPPPPSASSGPREEDPRLTAESAHWQLVQVCLDAYAQRMSATQSELAYIYDIMLNLGSLMIKAYPDRLRTAEHRDPEL